MIFGDAEPEDAWDPDDPVDELIDNLLRRLALLVALRDLDDRVQQRLRMLADDLEHVATRVAARKLESRHG